ncbi:MAG: hypothetical protein IPJ61_21385, partial [Tessaracoccus sp.]|uniref:hypothetical protein n=1 Tax=Tessaracoccus sp. TaxID=1971211 RepID=UPI001EC86277
MARHYIPVELHTRPDRLLPDRDRARPARRLPRRSWCSIRPTAATSGCARRRSPTTSFTFQFANRFDWLTFRYGIKESSGGVGADADVRWWGKGLALSVDVFDASFDQYPRVKLAAAFESSCAGVYVLGGIDDALNP